jgi:hypothetical protein
MIMSFYGKLETWKIVYFPLVLNNNNRGVAFVEARDRSHAMSIFQEQYRGQYSTVDTCEKLFG